MEMSLIAVASNSCLAIISLIVFLKLFWLMKVRSLSYIWLEFGVTIDFKFVDIVATFFDEKF